MKIIGVNGSPHANHNTGFLVKKVLEGAGKAGAETMLFHPERMKLRSCKACMACKKRPLACSIKDDMAGFVGAVEEGCGLVIGTPVYFDHVSAQLKMFLDRMYCFLGPDLKNHFPKKARAVLVMPHEAEPKIVRKRADVDRRAAERILRYRNHRQHQTPWQPMQVNVQQGRRDMRESLCFGAQACKK